MTVRDHMRTAFLKKQPTETLNRGVATQPCVPRVSPGPPAHVSKLKTCPQALALHGRLISARNAFTSERTFAPGVPGIEH